MAGGTRRSNGEGSIWREGDRWRGRITISGHRRHVRGRTRQEVVRKIEALKARAVTASDDSAAAVPGPATYEIPVPSVHEYLESWLERHKGRVRVSTARSYETLIRLRIVPAIGSQPISEVRFSDIDALVIGITQGGRSRSTAAQIRTILVQAFDAAYRDELIGTNPARGVRLPKAERYEAAIIPAEHRDVLLQAAAARGARELGRRRIALYLGLRQSEILGLSWDDIDFERATLTVQASLGTARGGEVRDPPKSVNAIRTLNVNIEMLNVLREVKKEQEDLRMIFVQDGGDVQAFNVHRLIFVSQMGLPIDPSNDHRSWYITQREAAALLGAPMPRYRIHDARHTVATGLIAAGVDPVAVSRFMGHATPGFTLTNYVQRRAEDVPDAETLLSSQPPQRPRLQVVG